jgi:hypothetical protein
MSTPPNPFPCQDGSASACVDDAAVERALTGFAVSRRDRGSFRSRLDPLLLKPVPA